MHNVHECQHVAQLIFYHRICLSSWIVNHCFQSGIFRVRTVNVGGRLGGPSEELLINEGGPSEELSSISRVVAVVAGIANQHALHAPPSAVRGKTII